jgi:hypothetical protein
VTERWVPGENIRRDLFGCIDLVAVRRGEPGVLGVQATSLTNVSSRLKKAQGKAGPRTWLAAGNRFQIHGWYRSPAGQWEVKIVSVRPEDLAGVVIQGRPRRGRNAEQPDLFADALAAWVEANGPAPGQDAAEAG